MTSELHARFMAELAGHLSARFPDLQVRVREFIAPSPFTQADDDALEYEVRVGDYYNRGTIPDVILRDAVASPAHFTARVITRRFYSAPNRITPLSGL